jgi:hypothetical protein
LEKSYSEIRFISRGKREGGTAQLTALELIWKRLTSIYAEKFTWEKLFMRNLKQKIGTVAQEKIHREGF